MRFRFNRSILAAALALAAAPAFAQDTFSQTIFFGDSLTDSGFYQPVLVAQFGPQAGVAARFTTNPGLVWAEFLADYYGTNATPAWQLTPTGIVGAPGDNFAAGGATVEPGPGYPATPPTFFAPSLTDQVNAYLAGSGGQADPDALYSVWGGANDLFFFLGGATTQEQFLAAAGDQVALVGALEGAGARYVLVPTLPDVGLTPFGLSQGAAGSAALTQLSAGYNATLFGGLQAAGLRVIPLDVFDFLHEISADPGTYGFTDVTTPACGAAASLGCNPANFVSPDAAFSHAFADGVHPTTAAHKLLADYAISVLEAPAQMAVLPHAEAMVGRSRADRIGYHVGDKPAADGSRWWTDLRGDFQRYGDGDKYDGAGPTLTFGMDWASGNLVYGGFAGYGRQGTDWGKQRGNFDQTDTSLGGFVGWYGDNAWVNGQVSYSRLGFDIDRDLQLGPATRTHHGSTNGRNISAGINAGWNFTSGAWKHGPVASLLSQHIRVDDFREDNPTQSTSLAYPEQTFNSLIGSVGWQASYRINSQLQPYARVTWDREFERSPEEVFAQMQALPGTMPYAVPGAEADRSYATIVLGARTQVFGLDANVGVSTTAAQRDGNDATVFATLGSRF
ncbi:autotransporter outer membrane beta-barrel domain-containing protein [Cognatiluteimonas telluris]|uniref:autotransporter outer membrane beta-barrel domain-containing protein n=1 Tax=Cognatiluteimonas telluris TaxID=1104775 RepID=UPI00140A0EC0|nr:autotransporter domain-containing protein [Lysobacter telluris]